MPSGREPFAVGQDVLLLLDAPDASNKYHVPIGSLGIFRIQLTPANVKLAVVDGGYTFEETSYTFDPSYEALLKQSRDGLVTLQQLISLLQR
jgi:hypothetical protein